MEPWFLVTMLGWPEGWAAISAGMVFTYIVLRHTSWEKPSPERKAFKAATVFLTFSLILTFVAIQGLKETVQVPRPCTPCSGGMVPPECNTYCTEDSSFPSGHAATIFSVCTVAILLLRRREGLLLYLLAGLVAWSRVALGVHTLPDILAGSLIGLASALVVWKVRTKMRIFS
jgi:membrane-associated phospholipid phosphatase